MQSVGQLKVLVWEGMGYQLFDVCDVEVHDANVKEFPLLAYSLEFVRWIGDI